MPQVSTSWWNSAVASSVVTGDVNFSFHVQKDVDMFLHCQSLLLFQIKKE